MQRLACLTLSNLIYQLGGASVKRHFRKRTSARTQDWPVPAHTPTHGAHSGTRRNGWHVWPDMA